MIIRAVVATAAGSGRKRRRDRGRTGGSGRPYGTHCTSTGNGEPVPVGG